MAGRWLLDRREADGTSVYLPYASFSGRPSRAPRPGLDLRPDGTFSWLSVGPQDGHLRDTGGQWQHVGPLAIELRPDGGAPLRATMDEGVGAPRALRLVP